MKFAELRDKGIDPPTSLAALILSIKKAVSSSAGNKISSPRHKAY